MAYADSNEQREYQRRWIAGRRAEYLSDKRCVDCGATEDLELDHRDPAEKISHKIWSWAWPRLLAEAAKCEVRCRTCHEERHDKFSVPKCGTRRAYAAGCRCPACKLAERDKRRRQRANRALSAA
jgi:hypothetical protein